MFEVNEPRTQPPASHPKGHPVRGIRPDSLSHARRSMNNLISLFAYISGLVVVLTY